MGGRLPGVAGARAVEALAEWLARFHLRQSELADLLEVHPATISQWLTGSQRPQVVDRLALQRLTGVPMEWWLTERERELLDGKLARITKLAKTKPNPDDIFTRLAGRVKVAS